MTRWKEAQADGNGEQYRELMRHRCDQGRERDEEAGKEERAEIFKAPQKRTNKNQGQQETPKP